MDFGLVTMEKHYLQVASRAGDIGSSAAPAQPAARRDVDKYFCAECGEKVCANCLLCHACSDDCSDDCSHD